MLIHISKPIKCSVIQAYIVHANLTMIFPLFVSNLCDLYSSDKLHFLLVKRSLVGISHRVGSNMSKLNIKWLYVANCKHHFNAKKTGLFW